MSDTKIYGTKVFIRVFSGIKTQLEITEMPINKELVQWLIMNLQGELLADTSTVLVDHFVCVLG